jgi:hypothetical protein
MPALTRWHPGPMPKPGQLALDMPPHCFRNGNRTTKVRHLLKSAGEGATGRFPDIDGRSGQCTKGDKPVTPW